MALSQVGLERLNTDTTDKIGTNKNLIINGAQEVAQRATETTGNTTSGYTTVDRFQLTIGDAGTWTISQSTVTDLQTSYQKRLVILLGELDNDPSLGTFRTTDLAMEQGAHRLERGITFFNVNMQLASKNNWKFNWKVDTIKNVGHDYKKMSESAIDWIKN